MAERPFIFRADNKELILPVTPASYQVEKGVNVEVVNIHEIGDAILLGYGTLASIKIDCLLPAKAYPFGQSDDPEAYITQIEDWIAQKSRIRFIIGGTNVNIPVVVERLIYGEQDGTNDIYATVTLREYRALAAVRVQDSPAASTAREEPAADSGPVVENYTVVYGDTLSGICRKFYGDGSAAAYNKLAAHNGIKNPNLIYAGATIKIPKPLT